jgi:hypothetical protein
MKKSISGSLQNSMLWLALVLNSSSLQAEPAHWFKWQSKLNGKMICKQVSPGEGWQQHAGPFSDAKCRKPVPSEQSAAPR